MRQQNPKADGQLRFGHWLRLFLLTALSLQLMAACTHSKATHIPENDSAKSFGKGSKQLDSCKILMKEDAEIFLGSAAAKGLGATNRVKETMVANCTYGTLDHSGKAISIALRKTADVAQAGQHFSHARRAASIATDISGLGDKAFWLPDQSEIHIIKKNYYLVINLQPKGPPGVCIEIAKKALERLKLGR